jgi:signal transduction histidine kinase
MSEAVRRPPPGKGLSARLLALTVAFVLLGEVLIYVPSIARFRVTYLEARLGAAHLASRSVELGESETLPPALEQALLSHAGVLSITLWRPFGQVMLGRIESVDRVYDLREAGPWRLVVDSLDALLHGGHRVIRVLGPSPQHAETLVDIVLDERALWLAMLDYSWRILALSIALSLIVALLLFLSLQRMIVRPLARITRELQLFREHPEDAGADPPVVARGDEIGVVERELGEMRAHIRQALAQKTRLAALGAAVSRINHDLKNILASGVLLSERLDRSADPAVRKVAPRLIEAMERAARLCADTLSFARSRPTPPQPRRFRLGDLVEDVLAGAVAPDLRTVVDVPAELELVADADLLYRVLLNVVRNARQVLEPLGGEIRITARAGADGLSIDVADSGPGVPEVVRARLFEPFAATSKADGSGLGLAIARELMRAQGGDIALVDSSPAGTTFRLTLPARCLARAELEKV